MISFKEYLLEQDNIVYQGNKLSIYDSDKNLLGYIKHRPPVTYGTKNYVSIEKVESFVQNQKMGTRLYKTLLSMLPPNVDGIIGYIPTIVNDKVFSIYKKLGGVQKGDYIIIDKYNKNGV
jgi:hypothetical protein